MRLAVLDGMFRAKRREVVQKEPDRKGFVVLKRRWVIERTFGWVSHWGGLLRERAGRLDGATGRLTFVACPMAPSAIDTANQYQWPKMLTHRAIEPSRIVYAKPEA